MLVLCWLLYMLGCCRCFGPVCAIPVRFVWSTSGSVAESMRFEGRVPEFRSPASSMSASMSMPATATTMAVTTTVPVTAAAVPVTTAESAAVMRTTMMVGRATVHGRMMMGWASARRGEEMRVRAVCGWQMERLSRGVSHKDTSIGSNNRRVTHARHTREQTGQSILPFRSIISLSASSSSTCSRVACP